ncbi:hypothetical protein BRADI_1g68131v3 [Brachypodium distachyon]|uniref:Uncharacterized protein n=1 Tax=Brachypodium distachyon TaxID=15368 RepID=A0A0Q3LHI3_BRADI|nr:hypothetical protein BRADI_1g68131v3 [Brachypodium distachyon]
MATITATPRVIAAAFLLLVVMGSASAAAGDNDEQPASPNFLLRPGNTAGFGFDCFTRCTGGCFAMGLPGDYCNQVCERECADDGQKMIT